MNNFELNLPTKIYFGENQIERVGISIKEISSKVLIVYGQKSVKATGLYDKITGLLNGLNINYVPLGGVLPNPRIDTVRKGVALCREHRIKFILAVGGGSVIDTSKAIAAGYFYKGDPWDFYIKKANPTKALPIGVVLTLSATGSEMNALSLIYNPDTQQKHTIKNACLTPQFTICDPTVTYSVSPFYTGAGVVDIFVHAAEQYFGTESVDSFLTDRFTESIMHTCIHYGPIALKSPQNYEARANLMWASSMALNGLLQCGKNFGDWTTHSIEKAISGLYSKTHGAGLAVIFPHWLQYVLSEQTHPRFLSYAQHMWQDSIQASIQKTCEFFTSLGMPSRLSELDILEKDLGTIAQKTVEWGHVGSLKVLDESDILNILQKSF